MTEINSLLVGRRELGQLFGLTSSRIGQLIEQGVLPPPESHGRYNLAACVKAYVRHLREGGERSKAQREFTEARTAWMHSRAEKAAAEAAWANGNMLPAELVTAAGVAFIGVARDRFLTLPNLLASKCGVLESPQEVFEAAHEIVVEALNQFSRLNAAEILRAGGLDVSPDRDVPRG